MSPVCFFARTPSKILRMVNICEVVDLFLWKPFWFFLRMFSILAALDVSVIPRQFLADPRSPILGKGRMHPFIHIAVSEQYVVELSGLPYFWGNLVKPCSFPIFNFFKNRVEFFLREWS